MRAAAALQIVSDLGHMETTATFRMCRQNTAGPEYELTHLFITCIIVEALIQLCEKHCALQRPRNYCCGCCQQRLNLTYVLT